MTNSSEPIIIQGGLGVAVSGWPLARAVSQAGQLGVVSGTGLDNVLARRLQHGDPDGALRRALAEFPFPEMVAPIMARYFVAGGKGPEQPYVPCPMPTVPFSRERLELLVVSNFVEVYLAKEHHDGLVGVNYLEKIQTPTLPSLYGAMLADVDYVLMGAGIPRAIPGVLDRLVQGDAVELAYYVQDAGRDDNYVTRFDPREFTGNRLPFIRRPKFLAIIASATLATMLARKATGHVDGFVVEGPTAGGHNAPPRGTLRLNDRGEPLYGPRDEVNLESIRGLGRPFWLAGSYGKPRRVVEALERGAAGVQVGTAFAYCRESGLAPALRQQVLALSSRDEVDVITDPVASPTGFPFKVVSLDGSLSDAEEYEQRHRVCDLGYLRHAYKRTDGTVGWRCGAEPVATFEKKGGARAETCGKKCVCNALLANIGLGQIRKHGVHELPLVTSGDDARDVARFLTLSDMDSYGAQDVIQFLLSRVEMTASVPVSP